MSHAISIGVAEPEIFMANDILLNCVNLGREVESIFPIRISRSRTVGQLQDEIKQKENVQVLAKRLSIWKLKDPLPRKSISNTLQGVTDGNKVQDALWLDPLQPLSEYFPGPPAVGVVHLFVKVPTTISTSRRNNGNISASSSLRNLPDKWCRREETVQILYEKLNIHRFIQVRGTPASGKTTLLNLLLAHIQSNDRAAHIHHIDVWDVGASIRSQIPGYPNPKKKTYLLFDNAEVTYTDKLLWGTFFKSHHDFENYRSILFCSYGSAGSQPVDTGLGTPLDLPSVARVSLARQESEDVLGTIGILLSQDEFNDIIMRLPEHKNRLAQDLQDAIFLWTGGHVGAVVSILEVIFSKAQADKRQGKLDLMILRDMFTFGGFCDKLAYTVGTWARGLPKNQLDQPDVADLFRDLLQHGSIEESRSSGTVQLCHKKGWIYSATTDPNSYLFYVLPSPLHRSYLEWKLLSSTTPLPFDTPLNMSVAAIRDLRPSQLSCPPRRVGVTGAVRPPEAAYQDEFYRSIFTVTNGCAYISSEYSSAKRAKPGRIDFFIPFKKWGIELVHDGNNLEEHASRFHFNGAYGSWLKPSDMTDYIILDFRSTRPKKSHNRLKNLYHVVFLNTSYNCVQILDNDLQKVEGFALVEH